MTGKQTFQDITGKRFNKVIVLDGKLPQGKALIKCDCGTEKIVRKYDVFSGKIKSCNSKKCVARTINLIGSKFGLLTIISEANDDTKKNIISRCTQWECLCDCGTKLIVPSNQLKSGRTKSCGCSKPLWISKKVSSKLPIKDRVEKQLYREYRLAATKRGYVFDLTQTQFVSLLYDNCFYCNSEPSNCMTKTKITGVEKHYFNGVDRLNNKIGYTVDNCATCCKICNRAKNDMTIEEFVNWLEKIINSSEKVFAFLKDF